MPVILVLFDAGPILQCQKTDTNLIPTPNQVVLRHEAGITCESLVGHMMFGAPSGMKSTVFGDLHVEEQHVPTRSVPTYSNFGWCEGVLKGKLRKFVSH